MAWRGPSSKPTTNSPPNKVSRGPEMSEMKTSEPKDGPLFTQNRALNVRRDTDKQKNFSVSLINIDTAILSYIDKVISPTIVDAGRQVKVPINYASPERWKAIQQDGALRDKNGKVQTPAIAFRRSTMQRNDGLITFNRYLQYPTVKQFSQKNKYDKFSVMSGFSPVKEIYSVAMPDHVIINYEFIIWTELVEQSNSIVEAINFATEDYWGDKQRFKFRTTISDYNFETATDAGNDRIVRSTFSMMCYAYLLPDKYENYKSVVQKAFTPRKIVFNAEVAGSSMNEIREKANQIYGPAGQLIRLFDYAEHAKTADYATTAGYAQYAATASYVNLANGNPTTLSSLELIGGGATGSFGTNIVAGITEFESVDDVPIYAGNAAMWLVSVNDGTNYKTSEVVASWNNLVSGSVTYYVTEVSEIGSVPVVLSVSNLNSGSINLTATPVAGAWTVKLIRMIV
jgi:hypothetical protein